MREVTLRVGETEVPCAVAPDGEGWVVEVGGQTVRLRLTVIEPGVALLETGGRSHLVHTVTAAGRTYLHVDGVTIAYEAGAQTQGADATPGGEDRCLRALRAPMPGTVTQVAARVGDVVRSGQAVVVVEAMKMEHVVRAGRAGCVRALHVRSGDRVDGGAVVAEIGPVGAGGAGTP